MNNTYTALEKLFNRTTGTVELSNAVVLNTDDSLEIQKYIGLIILKAQIDAYNYVFLIAATIVFLGSFTILFLKVKKERTDIHVHVE